MGMSDKIEAFILHLLSDEDDWIELKRNELAEIFNCVPSQINYVISTRFSPTNGYATESRRGGGGYLRIKRIKSESGLLKYITEIGNSIDAIGAAGLLSMRKKGAYTIGQDKESCVVYGMPKVAYDIGAVGIQASCDSIANVLLRHLNTLK